DVAELETVEWGLGKQRREEQEHGRIVGWSVGRVVGWLVWRGDCALPGRSAQPSVIPSAARDLVGTSIPRGAPCGIEIRARFLAALGMTSTSALGSERQSTKARAVHIDQVDLI